MQVLAWKVARLSGHGKYFRAIGGITLYFFKHYNSKLYKET
jgi:hypothetical protein